MLSKVILKRKQEVSWDIDAQFFSMATIIIPAVNWDIIPWNHIRSMWDALPPKCFISYPRAWKSLHALIVTALRMESRNVLPAVPIGPLKNKWMQLNESYRYVYYTIYTTFNAQVWGLIVRCVGFFCVCVCVCVCVCLFVFFLIFAIYHPFSFLCEDNFGLYV